MSTQTESTKTEGLCPWVAPGEGDLRSPCPALNSLANHGYISHSGKDLHYTDVLAAIKAQYGLDAALANVLTLGGVVACGHAGLREGLTFSLHDLARHNRIEHDGSLTHAEAKPGHDFAPVTADPAAIARALTFSSDGGAHMTLEDLARARVDAEGEHELDSIHARIGRGEVALTLLTMGDGERVSTDRLQTWYGEDRLPDDYVPPAPGSITVNVVNAVVDKVDVAMKATRDEQGSFGSFVTDTHPKA